jgi:hypothetical protein
VRSSREVHALGEIKQRIAAKSIFEIELAGQAPRVTGLRADAYCSNLAFRRGAAKSRNARSLIGRNRPATYTRLTGHAGGS